jgi:hypothetical protein
MPEPARLPLAETERAAALENPVEFFILPSEMAVVLKLVPLNWKAFRKSVRPQT